MGEQGGRRVLITGIASGLGSRLAARLETDDRIGYLAGLDLTEPSCELARTEFVRADVRNPLVAKVLDSARVDTLVHVGLQASPAAAGGRTRMKELNVIGGMQLLAGAQNAARLRKVVLRSTTAVYGARVADPALYREDADVDAGHQHGYAKDAVEVERYARTFARRRPDTTLTTLRLASLVGPTVESPLTAFLGLSVVPTVLGFDPRLQLCHEDDAVEVLHRSVTGDHPGTFNVAGPGVVYLSQAIRLAGRVGAPSPGPVTRWMANLLRRTGRLDFAADHLDLLQFGQVGDLTRLRERFDYEPGYSTREALQSAVDAGRFEPVVDRDAVARWEAGLVSLAARVRGREGRP